MNSNPYPTGRWTPRRKSGGGSVRRQTESIKSLSQAPLRELFWGIPESQLLEDARQRLEGTLLAALLAVPAEPAVPIFEPEAAAAA